MDVKGFSPSDSPSDYRNGDTLIFLLQFEKKYEEKNVGKTSLITQQHDLQ